MRARATLALSLAVGLVALGVITAPVPAATPPVPPPPPIPTLPEGKRTTCTTTGPAWVAYGIHTPNAPPRKGSKYRVTAWGLTCSKATALLKALIPKIPPNRNLKIAGPQGFTCKSRADGLAKNRMFEISCTRLKPAAMFSWEPYAGKVG